MSGSADSGYLVRPYEPADRDDILQLYELTFGHRSTEWFRWRYINNPYISAVPIHVAEYGGTVVAARPSLPIPLSIGETVVLSLMQVDPMVHPDHRRQGLFSEMASHVYREYSPRKPSISIGFPNEAVLGGLDQLGSELSIPKGVRFPFPEYFRIENPAAMVEARSDDGAYRGVSRIATPVVRHYLAGLDKLARPSADVSIDVEEGVPASKLADIVMGGPSARVHAVRDATLYNWRFGNPRYDYRTYLAADDDGLIAAVVIGILTDPGERAVTANISEIAPLSGADRSAVIAKLLGRAVDEMDDVAMAGIGGSVLPPRVLLKLGFHPGDRFPLSVVATRNHVLARPLTDQPADGWTVDGRRLSDPDNWRLTYFERALG